MSKIVYLEKTDIGATLTTWIYCAMWQLWAAEQLGYKAYINWYDGAKPGRCLRDLIDKEKFSELPNMFDWYFIQPHIRDAWAIYIDEIWTWENWPDPSPIPFMAQPLKVIKDFYKKNLIFNDVVNERGNQLVERYQIDFSNTIGITWRGTDARTDGRVRLPIDVYIPFIDDILEENPDARIIATSEETGILAPLMRRYSNIAVIDEFYSSPLGGSQNPERFSPMSGFERGLQPALMVWLFSKCKWYIKNRSSTGAVASWFSDGKIINIAHEETLSYHKMDDQVEIEGIKYPLYR